jgi:hypothetical protein
LFPCFKTKIDLHAKEDWQPPQSGQSLPHRIDQSGSTVSAASAIFGAWTKFQSENPGNLLIDVFGTVKKKIGRSANAIY